MRPVPLTCVLLDGALLVDPCAREEDLSGCTVTVLRAAAGDEVCGLRIAGGAGGAPVPMETVQKCLDLAAQRVRAVEALYTDMAAGGDG